MKLRIAIDIGGTRAKFAVIDEKNSILEKNSFLTKACNGEEEFTNKLYEHINTILKNHSPNNSFVGIGIGAPSVNEKEGVIKNAVNLPFSASYPILEKLKSEFKMPVKLTRDSIAAILGEWKFGAGKGFENLAIITLGTGLGGGFIINGEVAKGKNGLAGEIGHISLHGNQRLCGCGKIGCLETYVSATGLKRTYFELLAKHCYPLNLKKVKNAVPGSKEIQAEAEAGGIIAQEAFQITGNVLGQKLADLILMLGLEAIVIGGGLAAAGDWIFEPIKKNMDKHLLEMYKGKCQVLASSFRSNEGALLGAASQIDF